jgi:hypothetical protein
MNLIKGVAGGAAAGQVLGLAERAGLDPRFLAYVPLAAAFLVETRLKQPALAAGMAGASADRLLRDLGLNDMGAVPSKMKVKPVAAPGAKMLPPAQDMALQDYGYPMLNEAGPYASGYANKFEV